MGRKRYRPEQIINMLRAAEVLLHKGFKIADVCPKARYLCTDLLLMA